MSTGDPLADYMLEIATLDYAEELMRQADEPGLSEEERRELLLEAFSAFMAAVQIEDAA